VATWFLAPAKPWCIAAWANTAANGVDHHRCRWQQFHFERRTDAHTHRRTALLQRASCAEFSVRDWTHNTKSGLRLDDGVLYGESDPTL